jgi:hypothetical protein
VAFAFDLDVPFDLDLVATIFKSVLISKERLKCPISW